MPTDQSRSTRVASEQADGFSERATMDGSARTAGPSKQNTQTDLSNTGLAVEGASPEVVVPPSNSSARQVPSTLLGPIQG